MAGGYPPQPQYGAPQGYGQQPAHDPNAPYGIDPKTGIPFSDKEKGTVGFLQLLPIIIGFGGIGRLYAGDTGTGIAQLLLSCIAVGSIWSIIDGILILTNGGKDGQGRILRG